MNRTAHLNFPLNVDEFAFAHPYLGSNARGLAERIARKVINDQTVNLTDFGTFHVNQNSSFVNLFQHGLLNAVTAVNLFGNSLLNVIFADLIGF